MHSNVICKGILHNVRQDLCQDVDRFFFNTRLVESQFCICKPTQAKHEAHLKIMQALLVLCLQLQSQGLPNYRIPQK